MTVIINEKMKEFMNSIMDSNDKSNSIRDDIFNDSLKKFSINTSVRNANYYALDEYGLVIRKGEQNNAKSPFGWVLVSGKSVNIHVSGLSMANPAEIRRTVLQTLKQRWKPQFKPTGVLYRAMMSLSTDKEEAANLLK